MTSDDRASTDYVPTKMPEERPGQEGGKRHRNRLARTRALCEAALDCFLAQGIDAVTIDDVVASANMSKGSFYRYFENKEALIAAVFAPVDEAVTGAMGRCAAALEASADESDLEGAYGVFAGELLMLLLDQPLAVRLFLQERHGPATAARAPILALDRALVELALRMVRAGRVTGLLRDSDPKVSGMMVLGAVHELLWQYFQGRGPDDLVTGARELIELVLHGVRARPVPPE